MLSTVVFLLSFLLLITSTGGSPILLERQAKDTDVSTRPILPSDVPTFAPFTNPFTDSLTDPRFRVPSIMIPPHILLHLLTHREQQPYTLSAAIHQWVASTALRAFENENGPVAEFLANPTITAQLFSNQDASYASFIAENMHGMVGDGESDVVSVDTGDGKSKGSLEEMVRPDIEIDNVTLPIPYINKPYQVVLNFTVGSSNYTLNGTLSNAANTTVKVQHVSTTPAAGNGTQGNVTTIIQEDAKLWDIFKDLVRNKTVDEVKEMLAGKDGDGGDEVHGNNGNDNTIINNSTITGGNFGDSSSSGTGQSQVAVNMTELVKEMFDAALKAVKEMKSDGDDSRDIFGDIYKGDNVTIHGDRNTTVIIYQTPSPADDATNGTASGSNNGTSTPASAPAQRDTEAQREEAPASPVPSHSLEFNPYQIGTRLLPGFPIVFPRSSPELYPPPSQISGWNLYAIGRSEAAGLSPISAIPPTKPQTQRQVLPPSSSPLA